MVTSRTAPSSPSQVMRDAVGIALGAWLDGGPRPVERATDPPADPCRTAGEVGDLARTPRPGDRDVVGRGAPEPGRDHRLPVAAGLRDPARRSSGGIGSAALRRQLPGQAATRHRPSRARRSARRGIRSACRKRNRPRRAAAATLEHDVLRPEAGRPCHEPNGTRDVTNGERTADSGLRPSAQPEFVTCDVPREARLASSGRRTVNRAPPPSRFAAAILPPCRSTIQAAIASPSPVPPPGAPAAR